MAWVYGLVSKWSNFSSKLFALGEVVCLFWLLVRMVADCGRGFECDAVLRFIDIWGACYLDVVPGSCVCAINQDSSRGCVTTTWACYFEGLQGRAPLNRQADQFLRLISFEGGCLDGWFCLLVDDTSIPIRGEVS